MTLYLDSSAWTKRYLDEPDSAAFNAIIDADSPRFSVPVRSASACTADLRQAQAARSLGWTVLGT